MNFLAHIYLSKPDPGSVTGNFMGDFIKGRVSNDLPLPVAEGIVLHRSIDSFVERHPVFRRSRQRISGEYGHFRGVMVDLFYDHFLALEWEFHAKEPLEPSLLSARKMIEGYWEWLPVRLQELVPVIFEELLPSYRQIAGIGKALERTGRRVSRPNHLAGSEIELVRNYDGFRSDFHEFLPELVQVFKGENSSSSDRLD